MQTRFYLCILICTSVLFVKCQKSSVTPNTPPTPTYKITYNGNGNTGGSVPVDNQSYTDGSKASILGNTGNLSKSGFYFSNWNSTSDGTGTNFSQGDNLNVNSSNISLYADWLPSAAVWSPGTLPNSNMWLSVAFGNNTFVAVATGTAVSAYSTDGGKTWTPGTLPVSSSWSCIAYGAGKFVALTSSSISATSPDGINWTQRSIPTSGGGYSRIIYENKFVAVGPNGNPSLTSADGITWQTGTLPSVSYWTSVAFGNNTYVTVAGTSANAATSPDGITWTARTINSAFGSVAFGNGVFVAVSTVSSGAATSTDGINWTPQTLPSSGEWHISFANGLFVAIKANSASVATSTDGVTWKPYQTLPSAPWYSVAYGNGNFVAISKSNNAVAVAK